MTQVSAFFADIVKRISSSYAGDPGAAIAGSWLKRGISNAVKRLTLTSEDDGDVAAVWSLAFEQGAQEALRFARIVLSDPKVRGREQEALALIEQGLGHAAVIEALRAAMQGSADVGQGQDGNVIAFPSREAKA